MSYADDLVLFAKADLKNSQSIKDVLESFCFIFGLKVNLSKSKLLVSPNVNPETCESLCQIIGFNSTTNLGKYLGFPFKHPSSNGHDFDFIVDRVQKKLTGWKTNLLSMASRLVLATSVTSAIPCYIMQGTLLPCRIHNALDRVSRNFIWGSTDEKKKLHLVNWQQVTRTKNEGGLGVKAAKQRNLTLTTKLCWRFKNSKGVLWAKCLRKKYWRDGNPRKQGFSRTWSSITKSEKLCELGSHWIIGNNSTLSFWYDKWSKLGSLRSLIQGPFTVEENGLMVKDAIRNR